MSYRLLNENWDKGAEHKALMAKTRYIWLKNRWNLTDGQRVRLSELETLNLKINRADLLKQAFREFWDHGPAAFAKLYLDRRFWWATHSRVKPLRDFAWMLRRHQEGLLKYFRMPIDNGIVEGLNNKAKVISHKAYGFRTAKCFIQNLYHCMADLPLPKLCIRLCDEPTFIYSTGLRQVVENLFDHHRTLNAGDPLERPAAGLAGLQLLVKPEHRVSPGLPFQR